MITHIPLVLPFHLGTVNCYLLHAGDGFILVDTGASNQRRVLDRALAGAGCRPGNLRLILLTHGDFDHTGNARFLREKYTTRIAMHRADLGMVEQGDMFSSRKNGNAVLRWLSPRMFGFGKTERFTPDLFFEDGQDLAMYGLDGRVLSLPGHSLGSIGVLTAEGDLICGDLLENTKQPSLNSIMDDLPAAHASVERLKSLDVRKIYPGHGQPFSFTDFATGNES